MKTQTEMIDKKAYQKKYRQEHKKQIKEYRKKYREEHKEEIKEYMGKWYQENKNKPEFKQKRKKYMKGHVQKLEIKKKRTKNRKRWRKNNPERRKELDKNYRKENPEKCKARMETKTKYPITNQKCKYCGNKAEEHHHNTIPYQIDKFDYVCKNCHTKIHNGNI